MDLISRLLTIGFTVYEAKVYIELLQANPATGYQLSKKAGVPRSMVYEALGRLTARGMVMETHQQRATLYCPLPPEVLLDHHVQEQQHLIAGLREDLCKRCVAPEEDRLWSVRGRAVVLAYAVQMIRQARAELALALGDPELEALRSELELAHQRGLRITALLIGDEQLSIGEFVRHPPKESEIQNLKAMFIVIADKQETLIASVHPDIDMTATITRNTSLVFVTWQFIWMELFAQGRHLQVADASLVV